MGGRVSFPFICHYVWKVGSKYSQKLSFINCTIKHLYSRSMLHISLVPPSTCWLFVLHLFKMWGHLWESWRVGTNTHECLSLNKTRTNRFFSVSQSISFSITRFYRETILWRTIGTSDDCVQAFVYPSLLLCLAFWLEARKNLWMALNGTPDTEYKPCFHILDSQIVACRRKIMISACLCGKLFWY